jgi:SPP1 gp7 family putative phage head morphogenesis protein
MKPKRSIDPSHTILLRRQFMSEMRKRFNVLKRAVRDLFLKEDILGAKGGLFTQNIDRNTFQFATSSAKVAMFRKWLKKMVDDGVLNVVGGTKGRPWTAKYVESAYRKGLVRAYTDVHKKELSGVKWFGGAKGQFLRDAFASPVLVSQLELLATRSLNLLQGVTDQMSNQMSLILAEGLAHGYGPAKIARQMTQAISTLSKNRALVIARTEIINAHAEGTLDGFQMLGVDQVMAEVEFATAGDERVCKRCRFLEGNTYTIDEARGVIPVHPNCFIDGRTLIRVADGWKYIEDIEVGDMVLTHKGRYKRVRELIFTSDQQVDVITIEILNGLRKITVTEEHLVHCKDIWIPAKDIQLGTQVSILNADHTACCACSSVSGVQKWKMPKKGMLYNFAVEEDESYCAEVFMVHNCRCAWRGVVEKSLMKGVK